MDYVDLSGLKRNETQIAWIDTVNSRDITSQPRNLATSQQILERV